MACVVCCWIQSAWLHSCYCSLDFPLWKGFWSPFWRTKGCCSLQWILCGRWVGIVLMLCGLKSSIFCPSWLKGLCVLKYCESISDRLQWGSRKPKLGLKFFWHSLGQTAFDHFSLVWEDIMLVTMKASAAPSRVSMCMWWWRLVSNVIPSCPVASFCCLAAWPHAVWWRYRSWDVFACYCPSHLEPTCVLLIGIQSGITALSFAGPAHSTVLWTVTLLHSKSILKGATHLLLTFWIYLLLCLYLKNTELISFLLRAFYLSGRELWEK